MAMPNSTDMQLSVGFDLSSIPKSIQTLQASLKSQKIIANIAYQFKTPQGEVRKQIKDLIAKLQGDINSTPLNIPVDTDNLPRIRYALYDVSSVADRISKSLFEFGSTAVSAASDFESAFTNVERTTMANIDLLESMRSQLEGLSRDIPLAFKDITEIASLGAQLGIATSDLAGFSRTVAEFSAVTNVSSEQAAQSFGALGELLNVGADQYQNLGSAIAQVGVNSVATESEILSVSTQIAGVASSAGLSAQYVVGLSGALASLRIPAEQSRGALTRVFQEINRAAAEGGPKIQAFANVLGVSAEEASMLAQTDVQTFFSKFITGLSGLDNTSLTTTLDNLNLSELRVTNTLTRLSRNTELLSTTQADAASAFEDGTFLAAAYALRAEDLAAKLTILQNSFQELVATFGESIGPVLAPIIDGVSEMIQTITNALSSEAGKWTSGIIVGSAFVVATLLTIISTVALATASLFALRTAITGLGWQTATTGLKGLISVLFGVSGAAGNANKSLVVTSTILKGLPIFLVVSALTALGVAAFQAARDTKIAFTGMFNDSTGLADALIADTNAYKEAVTSGNTAAANSFTTVEYAGRSLNEKFGEAAKSVYYTAQVLGNDVPDAVYKASSAVEYNTRALGDNTAAWAINKLQQSEAFQELVGNKGFADFANATGFSVAEAFRLQASEGEDAVAAYYYRLAKAAYDGGKLTFDQIAAIDVDLANAVKSGSDVVANSDASGGAVWMNNFFTQMLLSWGPFGEWLVGLGNTIAKLTSFGTSTDQTIGTVMKTQDAFQGLVNETSILDLQLPSLADNTDRTTDSIDGLGGAAGGAAKKIYLLTDYANDLSSIWERAFDIRWSGGQTLDKITSAFSKIAKATADAKQEIEELNADIQSLNADKALQEYFLSVAEAYGDTLKAQEIRANLAKIDADLTKKTQSLQKAQDKTNKTLVGNSDAAIENRAEILDLVSAYQDHIKALAASGMKQDELRAKSQELKADFIAQATQLGYNVEELGVYAVAFDDVKAAIDAVPRDLTVDFNGDPALTAINEFAAKAKNALNSVSNTGVKVNADTSDLDRAAEKALILNQAARVRSQSARPGDWADQESRRLYEKAKNLASGGYVTGPGTATSDSIPANLSNGEYVVKAAAVRQYGVGFFDQLNQMKSPQYFSGVGSGASSVGMVSLSPEDRALLRNVGGSGNIVLYADSRELARSVNDGNRQIVAQGGRP